MSSGILLINNDLKVTGIGKIVVFVANELASRGFRVAVFAGANGDLWSHLDSSVRRFPVKSKAGIRGKLNWIRTLRKMALSGDFDIFHTHQRGVSLIARIAALGTGIKVIEHVHNVFLPPTRKFFSFRGHHLIACGTEVNKMLVQVYGRNPDIITTVLNAVPDTSAALSQPLNHPSIDKELKVIAIGSASKQKDPSRFIAAIKIATDKGAKIRAIWAGEGTLLEEMRSKVVEQRLEKQISFIGQIGRIDELLNDSDVLVSTSRWEGLPLAIIEAMAHGRPVIAPDVGSCCDAVIDGTNGIIYAGDAEPEIIATHLICLASDKSQLKKWGENSRSLYQARFTPDRMMENLLDVYAKVLKESHSESQ